MEFWESHDKRARAEVTDTAEVNSEGRAVYHYRLILCGQEVDKGKDLCGPVLGPEPSETEMLCTLASFVNAWAEALSYRAHYPNQKPSENLDLFPTTDECAAWAYYAEEFSLWAMDTEEMEADR
jgi:hypothetical protein